MREIIVFIIGIAIMLLLMIKTKMGPFLSMLFAALIIAMGCGISATEAISTITTGFGNTCKSLGIVIIFGTMLGTYLERANATQQIANTMLKAVGEDKADLALAATGYIVSIPVFSDVALIMLSPLAKAIGRKSKKFTVGTLGTVLALALLLTNALVAPTPAPLATAELLGLDVGTSILWGIPAAFVGTVVGVIYCRLFLSKKDESWWKKSDTATQQEVKEVSEKDMPGFGACILPIIVPILLILLNTTCAILFPEGSMIVKITAFLGDKNIALIIGVILCIVLLRTTLDEKDIGGVLTESLSTAGPVIFITAAGGTLAAVVNATSIGETLGNGLSASGLPIVLIPFLIAGLSKFAQGSGSVASIMAAGLTVPLVESGAISASVAFISICAGSLFLSHVNNSFFWVFANLFGYDTKTSMKSLALGQSVIAVGSLLVAIFMYYVLGI